MKVTWNDSASSIEGISIQLRQLTKLSHPPRHLTSILRQSASGIEVRKHCLAPAVIAMSVVTLLPPRALTSSCSYLSTCVHAALDGDRSCQLPGRISLTKGCRYRLHPAPVRSYSLRLSVLWIFGQVVTSGRWDHCCSFAAAWKLISEQGSASRI